MADKTIDQLTELTTLEANDLLIAYDVSELGDEKIRKITKTNAFAGIDVGDVTTAQLTSTSGVLQTNINGKSDTSHLHDSRYYTESEVNTISGAINTKFSSSYTRVNRTTNQSIPNNVSPYTPTVVQLNGQGVRSSTAWTLNGSYEVVVPAGVSYVSMVGQVSWATGSGDRQLVLLVDGVLVASAYNGATGTDINQVVGMYPVSANSKITLGVRQSSGGGALNLTNAILSVFAA